LPIDQKSVAVPTRLVAEVAISAREPSQAITLPIIRSVGWRASRRSLASRTWSITRACIRVHSSR
jgi:hypothetical protein